VVTQWRAQLFWCKGARYNKKKKNHRILLHLPAGAMINYNNNISLIVCIRVIFVQYYMYKLLIIRLDKMAASMLSSLHHMIIICIIIRYRYRPTH